MDKLSKCSMKIKYCRNVVSCRKSISLNGIVAAFNSTNIYKIIENRCSSKKCCFEPFYNLKSFIHNGASARVAEVGQSGSVAKNFFGEVVNTAQRKISIIRFYI